MANAKIIEQKATVVSEIKNRIQDAKSLVLFDYRGLSVAEVTELRRKLRESGSDYKVYKNTLARRASDELNLGLSEYLVGPGAISFGSDELSIVKVLSDFAKDHDKLILKAGIVDGKLATCDDLKKYAAIPSREGLLTMVASCLIGNIRDLSICLDLYSKEKNN